VTSLGQHFGARPGRVPRPLPPAAPPAGQPTGELLASLAAFFDAHVRAHPGTLRLVKLRELLATEHVGASARDGSMTGGAPA
jgi:hypothetical protein